MNTLTYVLSTDTLNAGSAGIDVFESGPTNLTISMSGILDARLSSASYYNYLKFLVKYSDLDDPFTLQNTTNTLSSSQLSISRVFYPTDSFYTTYNITVSGIKTDLSVDEYKINFTLSKPSLNFYKDYKLVNSLLHTNEHGKDTLLVTVEAENPNYAANFYIPFEKSELVYLPSIPEPFIAGEDELLRTEILTYGCGYCPIVTEQYSFGRSNQFSNLIAEQQYFTYAIGAAEQDTVFLPSDSSTRRVTGNEIFTGINSNGPFHETDINNKRTQQEGLIIIPEDGLDYSKRVRQTVNFISYQQNNEFNVHIRGIYANGDRFNGESVALEGLN